MNSLIRLFAFVGFALCFGDHARSQDCFTQVSRDCEAGVDVSCAANKCRSWTRDPDSGIWELGAHFGWDTEIKCGVQSIVKHEEHFTNATNVPIVIP